MSDPIYMKYQFYRNVRESEFEEGDVAPSTSNYSTGYRMQVCVLQLQLPTQLTITLIILRMIIINIITLMILRMIIINIIIL